MNMSVGQSFRRPPPDFIDTWNTIVSSSQRFSNSPAPACQSEGERSRDCLVSLQAPPACPVFAFVEYG
jgi:hypothetical protein